MAIYFFKIDKITKEQADKVKESQQKLEDAKTENERKAAEDELKKHLNDLIRIKP